jgi:hypothetical protein
VSSHVASIFLKTAEPGKVRTSTTSPCPFIELPISVPSGPGRIATGGSGTFDADGSGVGRSAFIGLSVAELLFVLSLLRGLAFAAGAALFADEFTEPDEHPASAAARQQIITAATLIDPQASIPAPP